MRGFLEAASFIVAVVFFGAPPDRVCVPDRFTVASVLLPLGAFDLGALVLGMLDPDSPDFGVLVLGALVFTVPVFTVFVLDAFGFGAESGF